MRQVVTPADPAVGRRGVRVVTVMATILAVAVVLRPSAGVASEPVPDASTTSPCAAYTSAWVSPRLVPVGAPVNIRYRLQMRCPSRTQRVHVAVVVDGDARDGAGMPLHPIRDLESVGDALALEQNGLVSAGVTVFGSAGGVACALDHAPDELGRCLARVAAGERVGDDAPRAWSLADAVDAAAQELATARQPGIGTTRDPSREVMLILNGRASECPAALGAVDAAVAAGIEVGVVCSGDACRDACTASLGVGGSNYHASAWPEAIGRLHQWAWSSELRVGSVTLREQLHSAMEVDPATFDPPGPVYYPREKKLVWHDFPVGNLPDPSFAYGTRPTRSGTFQVSARTQVELTDTLGRRRAFTISPPAITAADALSRAFLPVGFGGYADIQPLER